MIRLPGMLAVARFLGRRAFTGSRLVWWLLLALFPGGLAFLIRLTSDVAPPTEAWLLLLYALIPSMTCVLGTFLWVTATIQSEIDARTWIYLATRPYGATSLLIGNYLVGVLWTASVALAALAFALPIIANAQVTHSWFVFTKLILVAAPAYAAVYALIGVLFIKRAMFVAVMYTLIFEIILGLLPAIVNKLTIQFRLRTLAYHWLEIQGKQSIMRELPEVVSDAPPYQHVLVLIGITLGLLTVTVWLVHAKESTLGAESDF